MIPHLEICIQLCPERHGTVSMGPEEGDKNDQRAGTPVF